ncbi:MAG: hypothetical protein WC536_02425 [Patescibacteria group bacterium]
MNDDQKSKLLGRINLPLPEGGKQPNMFELAKPFDYKGTIIRSFCTGCGMMIEVQEINGLADLAHKAGITGQEDLSGKYFEAKQCPICSNDFTGVELKEIK